MAHRFNLVFGNSMKMFTSFHNVERLANKLYRFYSVSHKRSNSLADFLKMENDSRFHLSYVFDVRWVTRKVTLQHAFFR